MPAQLYDLIEDALGYLPLGSFGNFDDFVVGDDGDRVAIGVEADAFAGDVVDDDGVEGFGGQFLAGVFENVFGFGGKADHDGEVGIRRISRVRFFVLRDFGEDVGGWFEFERGRPFALDFLLGGNSGTEIGDGCSFDDGGTFGQKLQDGGKHFAGAFNAY